MKTVDAREVTPIGATKAMLTMAAAFSTTRNEEAGSASRHQVECQRCDGRSACGV